MGLSWQERHGGSLHLGNSFRNCIWVMGSGCVFGNRFTKRMYSCLLSCTISLFRCRTTGAPPPNLYLIAFPSEYRKRGFRDAMRHEREDYHLRSISLKV